MTGYRCAQIQAKILQSRGNAAIPNLARLVIDAIENTLHWCLDVTFREDESRLRNRFAAENLAWLKRFAIGPIKQNASKESIAMQRRMAGWNDNYLTQLLGLQTL